MNKIKIILIILFLISCSNIKKDKTKSEIFIESENIDLGFISINDTINRSIFIKNTGNNKFVIDSIGVSCGCTLVYYDKKPILTNEVAEIKIKYIAEEKGKVNKSIVVEANTDPPFHVFYLKGEVK